MLIGEIRVYFFLNANAVWSELMSYRICWSTGNMTDEIVNQYLEHYRKPNENDNFIIEDYLHAGFKSDSQIYVFLVHRFSLKKKN